MWIYKKWNDTGGNKWFYKWYEVGILGCGKESQPYIDMSQYIKFPGNADQIVKEITNNLQYGSPSAGGSCLLPKWLNGYNFLTHYEYFADKYIPQQVRNSINSIHQLDDWIVDNKLAPAIWRSALLLKTQPKKEDYWSKKHQPGAIWKYDVPLTQAWIDGLAIFKHVGRVMIYENRSESAVAIHRDTPINVDGTSNHFVNIQLTSVNRRAFVFDEVTREKIYTDTWAYMFNESDCHGVDEEIANNFTIRIDGEFHDEICEQIGLDNGKVFSSSSKSLYKLDNIKIVEPTDD